MLPSSSAHCGGLPSLAYLLHQQRAVLTSLTTDTVTSMGMLTTVNGDFLSASSVGERLQGTHMIDLMALLKVITLRRALDVPRLLLSHEGHGRWT